MRPTKIEAIIGIIIICIVVGVAAKLLLIMSGVSNFFVAVVILGGCGIGVTTILYRRNKHFEKLRKEVEEKHVSENRVPEVTE